MAVRYLGKAGMALGLAVTMATGFLHVGGMALGLAMELSG